MNDETAHLAVDKHDSARFHRINICVFEATLIGNTI